MEFGSCVHKMISVYHLSPHFKTPVKMLWLLLGFSWSVGGLGIVLQEKHYQFSALQIAPPHTLAFAFKKNRNEGRLKEKDLKSSRDNGGMLAIRVCL